MTEKCEIKRCRQTASLTYLGRGVCWRCWHCYMAESRPEGTLKRKLGMETP